MAQLAESLRALVRPLQTRIMGIVSRAVVNLSDDSKGRQTVQASVLAGEVRTGVERFQEYGFRSRPLDPSDDGACEAVVLFPGGTRSHGLAVACDDRRFRPAPLGKGEVALYTAEGDAVRLEAGRRVLLEGDELVVQFAGTTLTIDAGGVSVSTPGDFTVECAKFRVTTTDGVEFVE